MNFDFNTIKNAFRIKVKKILYIFVLFIAIIAELVMLQYSIMGLGMIHPPH